MPINLPKQSDFIEESLERFDEILRRFLFCNHSNYDVLTTRQQETIKSFLRQELEAYGKQARAALVGEIEKLGYTDPEHLEADTFISKKLVLSLLAGKEDKK
jgi:hypothetical protein